MKTMSTRYGKVILALVGIALLALVVVKLRTNALQSQERVYHNTGGGRVEVGTDTILTDTFSQSLTYSGVFEPFRESKVGAEIMGKVRVVWVENGDHVTEGQSLLGLDAALLKLQLEAVGVQIEGLEADVKRNTELVAADAIQGVQLEKSLLALRAAQIQQATLQEQIRKMTIVAPFSGVITERFQDAGSMAMPGQALVQVTDISQLRFTIMVPEGEIGRFVLQHQYPIQVDALGDTLVYGKVVLVSSKAVAGSQYMVQFLVPNLPGFTIRAGMYGTAQVRIPGMHGIRVPISAIQGTAQQPGVFVIRNGIARWQEIHIRSKTGNMVVIQDGLKLGDVLITSGFEGLQDGSEVLVK